MFIRWDKNYLVETDIRYPKLVKSFRKNGKVKHKVLASLGRVSFKGNKINNQNLKAKMLLKLVFVLCRLKPSREEIEKLLNSKNRNLQFTPEMAKKYPHLHELYKKGREVLSHRLSEPDSPLTLDLEKQEEIKDLLTSYALSLDTIKHIDLSSLSKNTLLFIRNLLKRTLPEINDFQEKVEQEAKERHFNKK